MFNQHQQDPWCNIPWVITTIFMPRSVLNWLNMPSSPSSLSLSLSFACRDGVLPLTRKFLGNTASGDNLFSPLLHVIVADSLSCSQGCRCCIFGSHGTSLPLMFSTSPTGIHHVYGLLQSSPLLSVWVDEHERMSCWVAASSCGLPPGPEGCGGGGIHYSHGDDNNSWFIHWRLHILLLLLLLWIQFVNWWTTSSLVSSLSIPLIWNRFEKMPEFGRKFMRYTLR